MGEAGNSTWSICNMTQEAPEIMIKLGGKNIKTMHSLPSAHQSLEPQNFCDLSETTMELETFLFRLEMICK